MPEVPRTHTMNELDLQYPPDTCPFCTIAAAYPPPKSSPLWNSSSSRDLRRCVPEGEVDTTRTTPASFVVLASEEVVAFLDILPMVGGTYVPFKHIELLSNERRGEGRGFIFVFNQIFCMVVVLIRHSPSRTFVGSDKGP